jgi:DNA mismatch repair protein MutL
MSEHATIRILPPELANQIAAGEVVERPASVLKELLENALDAGAKRLRVDLERGGQGLIRVTDDGAGIPADSLALAVTRHATSKIVRAEDLFAIRTFGFRGEALAAIASVSRLTLSSTPEGRAEGAQIGVEYGREGDVTPSATPRGTTVEVRDLFANTPARLKFLKSEATELKRCLEVVGRLALAHAATGFVVNAGGRTVHRFPPNQSLQARLAALWPPAVCEGLLPFDLARQNFRVHGLAGLPAKAQNRAERMLFYVGSRPVQDRLLLSAARQAYQGKLLAREYPQLVLFLELPAEEVDVNVHPAKLEVRFREESHIFAVVRQALDQALAAEPGLTYPDAGQSPRPAFFETGSVGTPELSPTAEGPRESSRAASPGRDEPAGRQKFASYPEYQRQTGRQLDLGPAPAAPRHAAPDRSWEPRSAPAAAPPAPATSAPAEPLRTASGAAYLGQVAKTYLILALPDGSLGLLDQHAAHERVLFAAFRRQGRRGDSRPLVLPLELALHASEEARLAELFGELTGLGFGLSRPKPGMLEVTALPPTLPAGEAKDYLRAALSGQARNLEDLWTLMSCRGALKAGEALAPAEALALIEAWSAVPDKDYCPHGRPVFASFSPADLERLFKRRG